MRHPRSRPSEVLGFRDVAAVMELLRAREGFGSLGAWMMLELLNHVPSGYLT